MRLSLSNTFIPLALTLMACKTIPAHSADGPSMAGMGSYPARYKGLDCDAAVKALQRGGPRDEFETTQSYTDRLARVVETVSIRKIPLSGPVTLVFDAESEDTYDADKGVMPVSLPYGQDGSFRSPPRFELRVRVSLKSRSEYVAQNRLGATMDVEHFEHTTCAVGLVNLKKRDGWNWSPEFHLPMAPAAARKAKANLRVAVEAVLEPPYVSTYDYYKAPSLYSDQSWNYKGPMLLARAIRFTVFDFVTGEVLAQRSAEEM